MFVAKNDQRLGGVHAMKYAFIFSQEALHHADAVSRTQLKAAGWKPSEPEEKAPENARRIARRLGIDEEEFVRLVRQSETNIEQMHTRLARAGSARTVTESNVIAAKARAYMDQQMAAGKFVTASQAVDYVSRAL